MYYGRSPVISTVHVLEIEKAVVKLNRICIV